MDFTLVLVENGIPVYVEGHRDLPDAKEAADEIVAEQKRVGPKDWSPAGRNLRAYVWSFIDGQIVWSKGFR